MQGASCRLLAGDGEAMRRTKRQQTQSPNCGHPLQNPSLPLQQVLPVPSVPFLARSVASRMAVADSCAQPLPVLCYCFCCYCCCSELLQAWLSALPPISWPLSLHTQQPLHEHVKCRSRAARNCSRTERHAAGAVPSLDGSVEIPRNPKHNAARRQVRGKSLDRRWTCCGRCL